MAQKVQVVLIDDIDGGPADETVRFAVDGTTLRDRSVGGQRGPAEERRRGVRRARPQGTRAPHRTAAPWRQGGKSAEIRAWAREQGLAVNERGRIPADLAAKFEAAQ